MAKIGKEIMIIHADPAFLGGFVISSLSGEILTPPNERPEWAGGVVQAQLAERIGWYEKRIGEHLAEQRRVPDFINFQDLGWVGVDAEGDVVAIDPDNQFRMEILAEYLEIDKSADNWEQQTMDKSVSVLVDHTYQTHPTDERTLAEVEGLSFEELDKAEREVAAG